MTKNKNFLMILVIYLVCILPVTVILVVGAMDRIMSVFYQVPLWIRIVSGIGLLVMVVCGRDIGKP